MALNPIRKGLAASIINIPLFPVISCQVSHYCSSQRSSQIDKGSWWPFSWWSMQSTSYHYKCYVVWRNPPGLYQFISAFTLAQACCMFCNLVSSSGGQAQAVPIPCKFMSLCYLQGQQLWKILISSTDFFIWQPVLPLLRDFPSSVEESE